MHAYYYTQVERPFDKVEEVVLRLVHRFDDWSTEAYRNGEELRLKMGLSGSSNIAKTITMTPGQADRGTTRTRIPIRWEATGPAALFPKMDADLTVIALGQNLTKLALQGNYRPPLGPLGASIDRFALHHVAESSVKHFVDLLAAAITEVVETAVD